MTISLKEFAKLQTQPEGTRGSKYDWTKLNPLVDSGTPFSVKDALNKMPEVKYRNQLYNRLEAMCKGDDATLVRTPKNTGQAWYVSKKAFDAFNAKQPKPAKEGKDEK